MKAVSEPGIRVLIQFLYFWQRMDYPIEESKKRKRSSFKGLSRDIIVHFLKMAHWPKWPIKGNINYFLHFSFAGLKFRYDSQKVRQKLT